MSLESPQLEDGFTPIANGIMDALARTRFSGYERSVLDFLFRKTYGWSKKSDLIALSQFVDATGIAKPNIVHTINRLVARKIVCVVKSDNGSLVRYEFNKHYGEWVSLSKSTTAHSSLSISTTQPLFKSTPTISIKDTTSKRLSPIIPKVGKRKKAELTVEESEVLAYLNLKADNSFTAPGEIGKRIAEGHTVEECKIIIDKKVAEWGKTEFAKNLNPTTLFRLCHFDTYLHQKSELSVKKFDLNAIGKSNMGEEWG
jgi:phage replication O-like protein O